MNINQTSPHDWTYLSEGGSTIVFSYAGPGHPKFTGRVLRLRKTTTTSDAQEVVAFQNTIIAALVPSEFLPDLEIVLLDAEWLTALEVLRDADRPAERRAKDQIDKARRKGTLATDLIGGTDILAIEIKPKWGFLPNPAHLSRETAEIKTSTCRYCMHTRFKFRDGTLPTQYCPLDLFSKDQVRVKKAVRDLWDGWVQSNGALNNMRVFLSGKMIRPSESYASLAAFLESGTDVHEALATALLPLLRTPVLSTISNLQRSLDALDIEGIVKLHAMAYPGAKGLAAVKDPCLSQLHDFIASYRSDYCALEHSTPSPEAIDSYLAAYLLSATFKDCSVIFRIRRPGVSGNANVDLPHAVSIIDLDPKGANRFEQWVDVDRRIVEYYRDVSERKFCVE